MRIQNAKGHCGNTCFRGYIFTCHHKLVSSTVQPSVAVKSLYGSNPSAHSAFSSSLLLANMQRSSMVSLPVPPAFEHAVVLVVDVVDVVDVVAVVVVVPSGSNAA